MIQLEEIFNFTQEDLDIDDPFMLDCFAEVSFFFSVSSSAVLNVIRYMYGLEPDQMNKRRNLRCRLL